MSADTLFDLPPSKPRPVYGGDTPRHRNARRTETAAANAMRPVAPSLRMRVLAWVRSAGAAGLTAIDGGAMYATEKGKHPSDGSCRWSVAPRLTELAQAGFVHDAGVTRDGCIAWVATAKEGDGRSC